MASYHWSMQIIGRKEGRSAIRSAAYRAGQDLVDERTGEVHRYGQRRGVALTEILLPPLTHPKLADRQTLWNAVEAAEVRDDAQLARELNVALPHELTLEQQHVLLRRYVRDQFVARGMIADVAIHIPRPGRGEDERNVHAHVMLSLRQGNPQGLHPIKTRAWNARDLILEWRLAWADYANRALAEAGSDSRIDARSLAEQRRMALAEGDEPRAVSLERTPELHMGPNAVEMARKVARARSLVAAAPLPDKVTENAVRIDHNATQAWHRHADAQAAEVRQAWRRLFGTDFDADLRPDRRSYGELARAYDRPPPRGMVGRAVGRMRDAEISNQAAELLRLRGFSLADTDAGVARLLQFAELRPVASSPFRITAKDLAFAFYQMGALSLDRLRVTLELIEAEAAVARTAARQESFWARLLPRARGRPGRQASSLVRRRHRANDPTDP